MKHGPLDEPGRHRLIEGLVRTASAWSDPDYGPRVEAVERTLGAPNRFTEEALAFAINQQMSLLTEDRIRRWIGERAASSASTVGVLNAGNVPLTGLQDLLAVVLTGHRYRGVCSSKSPVLLPAFAADWQAVDTGVEAIFVDGVGALWSDIEAVIATGNNETIAGVSGAALSAGLAPERMLLRGHRYGVAVLEGREGEDDREGLAEDTLLHEGLGCRNVAMIWAPTGVSPDPYLDAFSTFRAVFPVHSDTPGALKMQQAFLEATGRPHAYGEGLEFLISKGPPEPQVPGHVRWVEYEDPGDIRDWLRDHWQAVQVVVGSSALRSELRAALQSDPTGGPEWIPFGTAQRPPLDWKPDGVDTISFLTGEPAPEPGRP